MACTTEFIDFVCSQLEGTGVIRTRKMFGDWMIYIDEKPIVLACDNICYVKKLSGIENLMTDAMTSSPYPGAKEHYILDIEHRDIAVKVVKALLPLVPYPKKKAKK
jgi:TfoX/Sxy family transcriptional regulator of competence genes